MHSEKSVIFLFTKRIWYTRYPDVFGDIRAGYLFRIDSTTGLHPDLTDYVSVLAVQEAYPKMCGIKTKRDMGVSRLQRMERDVRRIRTNICMNTHDTEGPYFAAVKDPNPVNGLLYALVLYKERNISYNTSVIWHYILSVGHCLLRPPPSCGRTDQGPVETQSHFPIYP